MIRLAILFVIDFVFYWIGKPAGFIGRAVRDGWHDGFYAVEYALMAEMQGQEANLDKEESSGE